MLTPNIRPGKLKVEPAETGGKLMARQSRRVLTYQAKGQAS